MAAFVKQGLATPESPMMQGLPVFDLSAASDAKAISSMEVSDRIDLPAVASSAAKREIERVAQPVAGCMTAGLPKISGKPGWGG